MSAFFLTCSDSAYHMHALIVLAKNLVWFDNLWLVKKRQQKKTKYFTLLSNFFLKPLITKVFSSSQISFLVAFFFSFSFKYVFVVSLWTLTKWMASSTILIVSIHSSSELCTCTHSCLKGISICMPQLHMRLHSINLNT